MSVLLSMQLPPYFLGRPQFRFLYEMFTNHPSLSRCSYYNVSKGRVMYTDGTTTSEAEAAEDPLPIAIGFEETGFPMMIRSILLQVEQLEYDEHAVY